MPITVLPLSDIQVKNAKPGSKNYKLSDGKGLYVLVTSTGSKLWRFNYRFINKNRTLALGSYPEMTLAKARKRRDEARQLVANDIDPGEVKKQLRAKNLECAANTVELVADRWLALQEDVLSPITVNMLERRLNNDVYPNIGKVPISELKAKDILEKVLRQIESRGTLETAHRVRGVISQIMRYAVASGLCDRDATTDLRGAIKPVQRKHHAALDKNGMPDALKVGALLRAIEGYDGSTVVKCALRLHPLVATRPGELRHAEWSEIDLETATWSIPAGRMKMKTAHIVPLSPQAVDVLRELHTSTGTGRYL